MSIPRLCTVKALPNGIIMNPPVASSVVTENASK
jgi:hypothetical protein